MRGSGSTSLPPPTASFGWRPSAWVALSISLVRPTRSSTHTTGSKTASETVRRRPSGWVSDDRFNSGAYSRLHRRSPRRSTTRTRPAGVPRRPGGGPSPGFSGRSRVVVRSWVSVVISELEVDERRHAAGSERRDQEEYDRDGHPQRDRAEP